MSSSHQVPMDMAAAVKAVAEALRVSRQTVYNRYPKMMDERRSRGWY